MHEKAVEVTEWPEDGGNETIAGWLGCLFLAHRKPIHNSSIKLKPQPLETTNWLKAQADRSLPVNSRLTSRVAYITQPTIPPKRLFTSHRGPQKCDQHRASWGFRDINKLQLL